jgi:hypothetical protein
MNSICELHLGSVLNLACVAYNLVSFFGLCQRIENHYVAFLFEILEKLVFGALDIREIISMSLGFRMEL